ncbi:hypothetical protein Rsub_04228 [Raphidocelis subcapitata]|uniref:Uncharacterized protein n=1 Tax=Raphidocelis subcapitata TaxID=307507 RepID=A0A2V0NV23_9CHLO|nr:hypothetical protein Rsub_04228 [Raphidocelis subcapitata]|eukprot:GBF91488.1 hypothetical protein Rsub_04228 [Raphidocelis subcapitata]
MSSSSAVLLIDEPSGLSMFDGLAPLGEGWLALDDAPLDAFDAPVPLQQQPNQQRQQQQQQQPQPRRPRSRSSGGARRGQQTYYATKKAMMANLEAEVTAKRALVDELAAAQKDLLRREQMLQLSINARDEQMSVLEELAALGITPGEGAGGGGGGGGAGGGGGGAGGDTPEALLQLLREAEAALGELNGRHGGGGGGGGGGGSSSSGSAPAQLRHAAAPQLPPGYTERHAATAAALEQLLPPPLPRGGGSGDAARFARTQSGASASSASSARGGSDGGERGGAQRPLAGLPLTKEEATRRYLAFMQDASALLLRVSRAGADEEAAAAAEARLEAATRDLHADLRGYAWGRTATAVGHLGEHITEPGRVGDDALWRSALARVPLAPEVEEEMVAAWEEQERAVAAVHARQREVAARLRDLLGEEFRGLTLGREDARRSEMLAAAAELQRGLAAEDEAWMLGFKGLQGLMPPLATAQLLVACFPFWPDAVAIMRLIQERVRTRAAEAAAAAGPAPQPAKKR